MSDALSVHEAASRLQVNPQRVRALISEGRLPAVRIGRDYVLSAADVAAFARLPRRRGRPFSAHNAWVLLGALSGRKDLQASSIRSLDRLRALRREGGAAVIMALVHSQPRWDLHSWRVLPIDVERLMVDPRLVRTGVAANHRGFAVRYDPERDGLDAYVSSAHLAVLWRRLKPVADSDVSNVLLRVPRDSAWILEGRDARIAPPAVAAADLLGHEDERVRRSAYAALQVIVDAD